MVKLLFIAMLTLLSCRETEQRKIIEFQLKYDTQDHIWKINNQEWINNETPTANFHCASNEICVKSLPNCTYIFTSQVYQFTEVTPLNFQNQPQIIISSNQFKIIPDCNYFNDTDILTFKIKAYTQ